MTPEQQGFIDNVLGYAHEASGALGIPVSAILAQWADETGWGTSPLFIEHHNFAGVTGDADGQTHRLGATVLPSGFLGYPSPEVGARGYVMRWDDPIYANTRDSWKADASPLAVAKAMEASPWAAGHYNFRDLEVIIQDHGLTRFDNGPVPAPKPTPQPEQPCGALPAGPAPAGHRTLRVGMSGADVAELQHDLRVRGFVAVNSFRPDGQADGIFGPGTASAVVAFQEHVGVRADGIVGRQTWCALGVR